MKLFDYLDVLYQKLSLDLAREYTIAKDAECKAIHMIIGWQRFFFKYIAVPKLITKYLLTRLHLIKPPVSPLSRPLASAPRVPKQDPQSP